MLEETIKELTEEVRKLATIITHLRTHELKGHNPQADDLGITQTEVINEPETAPTTTPRTRQEIQDYCLGKIKKDKASKAVVKEIMQRFGAELLKDVAEKDLTALDAALIMELGQ